MSTTLSRMFRRLTGDNGTTDRKKPRGNGKLGTFLGVFTPTVLTILGVIMYLRFGWVVGQVGLFKTLLIVILANGITVITSLCLSAIATNSRVGVGGAYFIISRSLGLEIGGAIGLPLFLSQAFSITLYAYGLAESLRFVWPGVPVQLAAFAIILAVGALRLRGAGFALKTQVPIMVLIGLSLLALCGGSLVNGSFHNLFAEHAAGRRQLLGGVRRLLPGGDRDHGRSEPVRRSGRSPRVHSSRHPAGDPDRLCRLPDRAVFSGLCAVIPARCATNR